MNGLNNITNPQSISNTTVQPSVLNGGNLSRTFNTQVMKVIRGIVNLSNKTLTTPANLYPVIEEHTGKPIMLGQSDFIVGYGVCNRSTNVADGQALVLPITPTSGNTPVLELMVTSQTPLYNTTNEAWEFPYLLGTHSYPVTPYFTTGRVTTSNNSGATGYTGGVNLGFGSLTTAYCFQQDRIIYTSSCGHNVWLQLRQSSYPFTIVSPAVNAGTIGVTLIVLSVISSTYEGPYNAALGFT
jgi:hypothetical protein